MRGRVRSESCAPWAGAGGRGGRRHRLCPERSDESDSLRRWSDVAGVGMGRVCPGGAGGVVAGPHRWTVPGLPRHTHATGGGAALRMTRPPGRSRAGKKLEASMASSHLKTFVIVAVAVVLAGCGAIGGQATPTAGPEPTFVPVVSATGQVIPVRWASLSMPTAGLVGALPLVEGDTVEIGELLLQLS